jgi:hypothetical protein
MYSRFTLFLRPDILISCLLFVLFSPPVLSQGFIENRGQVRDQSGRPNPDVLFLFAGNGYNIQLRKGGYSYDVFQASGLPGRDAADRKIKTGELDKVSLKIHRVDVDFSGTTGAEITGSEPCHAYLNYYSANVNVAFVNVFRKVLYRNIYPHIDVEFIADAAQGSTVKYNIILHPGARSADLKFLVSGASSITKVNDASININTSLGGITENIPLSYYTDSPSKHEKVDFQIHNSTITFRLDHDPTRTLVIDPSTNRIWSTYSGGTQFDFCKGTGTDAQDNVYISGFSMSTGNIATNGAYQSTLNGALDGYLIKFNENGTKLWGTYYGGSSSDAARVMRVEPSGNVYLAGSTTSTTGIASSGAYQTVYGGGIDDAFLAKFNTSGQLIWSTYFGGIDHDIAEALTIDRDTNVLISGHTSSPGSIATAGAYGTSYNGNFDVFIAKFDSAGTLKWGSYFGDSGVDEAYGMVTDTLGDIYVTGGTTSLAGISTPGSHQTAFAGYQDGFLSKFNATGTSLLWSTYFGGQDNDFGTAIAVNKYGTVFFGGTTTSSSGIASTGAYQTSPASFDESFMASFSPSGVRLWSTYYGGIDVDYITALIIDNNSDLFFSGTTNSPSLATTGSYQFTLSSPGYYDAYFAQFTASGQRVLCTYFGGESDEFGTGIAKDSKGRIYLGGETTSSNSIATSLAHQTAQAGMNDGFLAKFCLRPVPVMQPQLSGTICVGTITLSAQSWYTSYSWNNTFTTNPLVVKSTSVAGTYSFFLSVSDYGCEGYSDTIVFETKKCINGFAGPAGRDGLAMYPVPAKTFINVQLSEDNTSFTASVYSCTGQLILSNELKGHSGRIDLHELPPGLYVLKVQTPGGSYTRKLIKE